MRLRGIEPPRAQAHTDLNRARLPIPPQPRGEAGRLARRYREAPGPPRYPLIRPNRAYPRRYRLGD
jgi:hypothetical protein